MRSVEYRRLEQAMIILNNLSFDEINADMMANKSPALFEFLIVATFFTSREPYVNLKRHSLDILANVAKKMRLKRLSAAQNSLLVGTLHQLIVDQEHDDRLDLIRALEILSKLCGRELGRAYSFQDLFYKCILLLINYVFFRRRRFDFQRKDSRPLRDHERRVESNGELVD